MHTSALTPLTPIIAAATCGLSASYLARLRQEGITRRPGLPEGPKFRRIGRKIVYLRHDLDAWLSALPTVSVTPLPKCGRPTKAAQIARRQRAEG